MIVLYKNKEYNPIYVIKTNNRGEHTEIYDCTKNIIVTDTKFVFSNDGWCRNSMFVILEDHVYFYKGFEDSDWVQSGLSVDISQMSKTISNMYTKGIL